MKDVIRLRIIENDGEVMFALYDDCKEPDGIILSSQTQDFLRAWLHLDEERRQAFLELAERLADEYVQ